MKCSKRHKYPPFTTQARSALLPVKYSKRRILKSFTIINHIRYLSQQAKDDTLYYMHNEYGYNYRMTNLQAVLGLGQLEKLDELKIKKRNYMQYCERLTECDYAEMLPFRSAGATNYWFYSFALKEPDEGMRNRLVQYMNDRYIQVRPIWKLNHLQPPPFDNIKLWIAIGQWVFTIEWLISPVAPAFLNKGVYMKEIALSRDFLNSNKILFHYGRILEDIAKGQEEFNPIAIEIHPTAMCNHHCIHCSYKERNESRATISKDVMDKLIDSVIRMKVRAVYFSGGGEPTLYPGLADYINELYANDIECSIITNGSCFEKMGLIAVADKLNYIAVSVPGVDYGIFKTITGTDNLEKVLSLPRKIKEVHGDNSPVIGSRVVLTNKNYRQLGEFLRILKERKFDYALFKVVRDYEDNGQGLSKDEEEYLKEEINRYKNVDDNFTNIKAIFNYKTLPDFRNKCWINQYGMLANVSTDGKVYPNIVEIDKEEYCIGNLYEEKLEDMWNRKRHNEVKRISNEKWLKGECRNCRAMAYNVIINEWMKKLPAYFDSFI